MRIVDLKLNVDGLILKDDESVEKYVEKVQKITNNQYKIQYEVLYEEEY